MEVTFLESIPTSERLEISLLYTRETADGISISCETISKVSPTQGPLSWRAWLLCSHFNITWQPWGVQWKESQSGNSVLNQLWLKYLTFANFLNTNGNENTLEGPVPMRSLNCFSLPVKSALLSKQRIAHSTYPFSQWVKSREKQPLWSHKSIFSSLWNNLINSRQELSSSTKPQWVHMQRITQSPAWNILALNFILSVQSTAPSFTILWHSCKAGGCQGLFVMVLKPCLKQGCSLAMKYNQQVIWKNRTLKSSLWVCFLLTFNTIWFFV